MFHQENVISCLETDILKAHYPAEMTLTLNAAIINTFVTMDQMAVCVYERGLVKF